MVDPGSGVLPASGRWSQFAACRPREWLDLYDRHAYYASRRYRHWASRPSCSSHNSWVGPIEPAAKGQLDPAHSYSHQLAWSRPPEWSTTRLPCTERAFTSHSVSMYPIQHVVGEGGRPRALCGSLQVNAVVRPRPRSGARLKRRPRARRHFEPPGFRRLATPEPGSPIPLIPTFRASA